MRLYLITFLHYLFFLLNMLLLLQKQWNLSTFNILYRPSHCLNSKGM